MEKAEWEERNSIGVRQFHKPNKKQYTKAENAMIYKNNKKTAILCKPQDKASDLNPKKETAIRYICPSVEVHYVALENGIATCSAQVNNSSGEVKEDWGDENNYNNDINFIN
jgi:hypothetical protein